MALPKQRTTETMSASEARRHFSDTLNRVRQDEVRIVVEKSGIPVGAFVSMNDMRRLEEVDREWAEIEDVFRRTQAGFDGASPEALEREVEKAIAEVEADYKAARRDDRNSA
jgi:prevent-host-death family protein